MDKPEKSKAFTDIVVWQKAHRFVLDVYTHTKSFPRDELYALTSQFRRAAISIPANIAEGFKKRSIADKARFYNIAQGSAEESRYFLILSSDLGYGSSEQLSRQLEEVSKMLEAYIASLLTAQN